MSNYPPGVTNLPNEVDFVGWDWLGKELYRGDEVYDTPSGLVLKEDVEEFMEFEFGKSFEME